LHKRLKRVIDESSMNFFNLLEIYQSWSFLEKLCSLFSLSTGIGVLDPCMISVSVLSGYFDLCFKISTTKYWIELKSSTCLVKATGQLNLQSIKPNVNTLTRLHHQYGSKRHFFGFSVITPKLWVADLSTVDILCPIIFLMFHFSMAQFEKCLLGLQNQAWMSNISTLSESDTFMTT